MIVPIALYPHPVLRQKSSDYVETEENRQHIQNLKDTYFSLSNCVGLAFNQINIPLRGFIV